MPNQNILSVYKVILTTIFIIMQNVLMKVLYSLDTLPNTIILKRKVNFTVKPCTIRLLTYFTDASSCTRTSTSFVRTISSQMRHSTTKFTATTLQKEATTNFYQTVFSFSFPFCVMTDNRLSGRSS